jgi:heme exporter protein D
VSYIYSPPRRRRRGVWLLAVLSVAVLIVVLVTSLRSERRVLAGYIDTVQESAAAAASSATEFVDLTDRLGEVDRQEFITTMARIRTTAGEAGTLLESADVPTDALPAHARIQLAHSSWSLGLDLVEGATLSAADDPAADTPAQLLTRAAVELAVGDRAYEAAIDELLSLEDSADVDIPTYPVVEFSPPGGAAAVLDAARTSTGLTLRSDLAVSTVTLDPRVLSETDAGVGIVPFTDRLIVNVTVTNQGNVPLSDIPVQVFLGSDRSGTSSSESEIVDRLEPAEATSLEFLFEVLPVVNYEIVVNLGPAPGEFDTDNNLYRLRFVVNEEG